MYTKFKCGNCGGRLNRVSAMEYHCPNCGHYYSINGYHATYGGEPGPLPTNDSASYTYDDPNQTALFEDEPEAFDGGTAGGAGAEADFSDSCVDSSSSDSCDCGGYA